ncbi:MAG: SusE domain-containing protein [Muribaculaceae bacterium]|nr:SusE domain-containing protein [Muribaculaceae bacterium]
MKKFIYLMAGMALAVGGTGCADTQKPVFQEPTTFTVNAPAFQDEFLATTGDMESKETFVLTCSQPDYGFAAKANYNAQVSLTGEFKDEVRDENDEVVSPATYATIQNQDVNNAAMSLRTYDLAVAMCTLLNINSEESWEAYLANGGKLEGFKVYMRATCEIAGVAGSFIASDNTVSYNNVGLSYAVPTAGKIFLVGDVAPESEKINFTAPTADNKEFYQDYALVEPEIGCKIYAGTFLMPSAEEAHAGATIDNVDTYVQWRFFTELNGWADKSVQVASHNDDFYKLPINELVETGVYNGDAVYGQGNWGVFLEEASDITMAVSLVDPAKPKVFFRMGKWDVTIAPDAAGINEPVFTAPEAE